MFADRGQMLIKLLVAGLVLLGAGLAARFYLDARNRDVAETEPAMTGVAEEQAPTTEPAAGAEGAALVSEPAPTGRAEGTAEAAAGPLPRLLDLGAGKCVACKMMAPVLEDLKKEYEGKLRVDFIDVWKDAEASKRYGVTVIPTQIFFDPSGKELFRHQGYLSKDDILAKWREFGYELDG